MSMKAIITSIVLAAACTTLVAIGVARNALADQSLDHSYIVNRVAVPGYPRWMFIPKRAPDVLYALVEHDGSPKATDRVGLYVFDISGAASPAPLAYLPISSPRGIDLSPDENTLYIYSRHGYGYDPADWYGIRQFDLSDPRKPREHRKYAIQLSDARLSKDGRHLFVSASVGKNPTDSRDRLSVYALAADEPPMLMGHLDEDYGAMNMHVMPDGRHMIAESHRDMLAMYDVSDPAAPKRTMRRHNWLGSLLAVRDDGVVLFANEKSIALATVMPRSEVLGSMLGDFSNATATFVGQNENVAFVTSLNMTLHALDVGNPKAPKMTAQYAMPSYLGTATLARHGQLIYVGLIGSIVVVDPVKAVPAAKNLMAAHAEALKIFHSEDRQSVRGLDLFRAEAAIKPLVSAGIISALDAKPPGLSGKVFANILNDYGYFLAVRGRHGEAIQVYRRVTKLDPKRAVVFLNLGDSLRAQLSTSGSFEEKLARTADINFAYGEYKGLGGAGLARVDGFLALNVLDHPVNDICTYITTYANQGRLREMFGQHGTIVRAGGHGTMNVSIRADNTAHMPYISFFDNETDQEVLGGEISTEEDDQARWAENIAVVPFIDGHHLLYYNDGGYLISSKPIGVAQAKGKACRFSVQVIETFDKTVTDPTLCQQLLTTPIPYIEPVVSEKFESLPEKTWVIDFDNDGQDDALGPALNYSESGRGCDYQYFDLARFDEHDAALEKKRNLLHELQRTSSGGRHGRSTPSCRENVTGWFKYNGTVYYETKYSDRQPRGADSEFHFVGFIKDGRAKTVCEASFQPRFDIAR